MPSNVGVTIYAVAERAGVSISTVSRVLRGSVPVTEPTRRRVLDAARDLKYVPSGAASSLATQRQPTLGLVLPHLEGEYYAGLLIDFELAAAELGYSVAVTLANPRSDARAAVRTMAERVEGLAFMARSAAGDDLISELAGPRAVVTVARRQVPEIDAVFAASRPAAAELTGHLIDTGRRRIRFVGTPEPGSDLKGRHDGYREAMTAHDLEPLPAIDTGLDEASARALVARLLADGLDCDAVVCGNDLIAIAFIQILQDAGVRVPDDLAVTGWDDILTARYITPALTTVSQPIHDLARIAVLRLHEQLTGTPTSGAATVLDSTVLHRRSCCTPAAQTSSHTPH